MRLTLKAPVSLRRSRVWSGGSMAMKKATVDGSICDERSSETPPALEKRTVWAMASLSFLAVYRELFEVVLFYQALWAQSAGGGHSAVLAGVAASAVVLGALGWAIFRYSVRLPLGPFFRVMLGLVLLFAFVFAGDGIAKLQEAGTLRASSVRFIAVPVLGIHPTLETLAAQLAVVALIALSYWVLRRRDRFADRRGLSRTG